MIWPTLLDGSRDWCATCVNWQNGRCFEVCEYDDGDMNSAPNGYTEKQMTNGEIIRHMDDNELADLLHDIDSVYWDKEHWLAWVTDTVWRATQT